MGTIVFFQDPEKIGGAAIAIARFNAGWIYNSLPRQTSVQKLITNFYIGERVRNRITNCHLPPKIDNREFIPVFKVRIIKT